jgi:hypothetical protein
MPPTKPPEQQDEQDTFDEVLKAIDASEFEPDRHISIQLDRSLREAIQAAQTSNKPASVTIAINVRPGPDRRVEFAAKVTSKLPKPPTNAVTLFADANGTLHKSDPRQMALRLSKLNPAASPKEQ